MSYRYLCFVLLAACTVSANPIFQPEDLDPTEDGDKMMDMPGDDTDGPQWDTGMPFTPSSPQLTCGSDPFEPNENGSIATPTGLSGDGDQFVARDIEMDGTSRNELDLYAVTVPEGCELIAAVDFVHAEGDITIQLHGTSGLLTSSMGSTDGESLRWIAPSTSAVTFAVLAETETCSLYDIELSFDCTDAPPPPTSPPSTGPVTGTCGSDPYEPNNSIAAATATGVAAHGDTFIESRIELDGSASTPDHDVYRVQVPDGCTLDASVLFSDAASDIDMNLLDVTGYEMESAGSTSDNEYINWTNDGPGSAAVYLEVFPYGSACSEYDVDLRLTCAGGSSTPSPAPNPPGASCGSDPHEPNNSSASATSTGVAMNGDSFTATQVELDGATTSDTDVYEVFVPWGCELDVEVLFSHADGDIDVNLESAGGAFIDDSSGTTDMERLIWRNTNADTVAHITVFPFGSTCSVYDIDVSLTCMAPAPSGHTCGADALEPNSTLSQATNTGMQRDGDTYSAGNLEMDGLHAVDEDDLFGLWLPTNCTLDAFIFFTHGDGDIDVAILDDRGAVEDESESLSDSESLSWTNTGAPSVHYVRVYAFTDTCSLYDIDLAIECP